MYVHSKSDIHGTYGQHIHETSIFMLSTMQIIIHPSQMVTDEKQLHGVEQSV